MMMVGVGICAANSANSSVLEAPFNGLWRLLLYPVRVSANGDCGFQLVGSHINLGLRVNMEVV